MCDESAEVALLAARPDYRDVMARALRMEDPSATYHVTARGNNGEGVYASDFDRASFLALLERVVSRYHWSCEAYCHMTTHYHLFVSAPE